MIERTDARLWWEQTDAYWELPFFAEMGVVSDPDRAAALAMREQLWAIRENLTSI